MVPYLGAGGARQAPGRTGWLPCTPPLRSSARPAPSRERGNWAHVPPHDVAVAGAHRTHGDTQAPARMVGVMAVPASGLRGLMAHGVGVLLHLLRGQVLFLPLPHLVEAGEAMHVAEGVSLEALVEVGLGHRPALLELAREIVHGLDGRAEGRPREDRHRD